MKDRKDRKVKTEDEKREITKRIKEALDRLREDLCGERGKTETEKKEEKGKKAAKKKKTASN